LKKEEQPGGPKGGQKRKRAEAYRQEKEVHGGGGRKTTIHKEMSKGSEYGFPGSPWDRHNREKEAFARKVAPDMGGEGTSIVLSG